MRNRFTGVVVAVLVLLITIAVPQPVSAEDAAATYKARCAACHGADGGGDTVMGKKLNVKPLGSPEVQKQSDGELQKVITAGRNKMPGFGTKFSAAQTAELVKLVRGFAAK